jgi:RNA polymerase sigma-70 factor (ECF subfamily)
MARDVDDQGLVEAIAAGDREALGELYDRYASALMALGLRRLGDREEVEDVLHDVFLEVWRRADTYESSRGTVQTWLMLRMRSRTLDRARTVRRNRLDSLDDVDTDSPDWRAPDDPASHAEHARLRQVIDGLPARLRQVLGLTYFRGHTCREASELLDIPLGTVKSRLAAARERLEALLGAHQGGST